MDIIPDKQPYIEDIPTAWYSGNISRLSVLRLDVIHKDVSGNKWYKLTENIEECKRLDKDTILTFGGGYSNHLAATAAVANLSGLQSVGIIRGVYTSMTPTLQFCIDNGMKLQFVTSVEYKRKKEPEWLNKLAIKYNQPYIVPEGGANREGRVGAEAIGLLVPEGYTHIALSVGTGTTLVGVTNATNANVIGFAPMKRGNYLFEELKPYINPERIQSYSIQDNWHFGGFGKCDDVLVDFMNEFYDYTSIPLDYVYTAKMMYGIRQQINAYTFNNKTKLLCIHTGGLQGNASLKSKLQF